MRIIFMGTPEFAIPSFNMLVANGYDVVAAVCQPDKPKGRGNKLTAPPVKEYAISKGIDVLQPEKVRTDEFIECIKAYKPDLMVTAAYGKILPQGILDIPRYGCINVHGSLLPKYRGAAPYQWAIINGEKITGITTMYTDIGMDTGDMLVKKTIEIDDDMTAGELHDKLSLLGAEALKETLEKLKNGTLVRVPQNHEEASHASMLKKDTGLVDWGKTSIEIHNLVRGTNPWPGAFTYYKGDRMRIWRTSIINEKSLFVPGTICSVSEDGINVATADGMIKIIEVQFDSCRKMCVDEYICGHKINEGDMLGQES